MASRDYIPSNPKYLLEVLNNLPEESDSDSDFDGYLDPEDGPVVSHIAEYENTLSPRACSHLLEDLRESQHRKAHTD